MRSIVLPGECIHLHTFFCFFSFSHTYTATKNGHWVVVIFIAPLSPSVRRVTVRNKNEVVVAVAIFKRVAVPAVHISAYQSASHYLIALGRGDTFDDCRRFSLLIFTLELHQWQTPQRRPPVWSIFSFVVCKWQTGLRWMSFLWQRYCTRYESQWWHQCYSFGAL